MLAVSVVLFVAYASAQTCKSAHVNYLPPEMVSTGKDLRTVSSPLGTGKFNLGNKTHGNYSCEPIKYYFENYYNMNVTYRDIGCGALTPMGLAVADATNPNPKTQECTARERAEGDYCISNLQCGLLTIFLYNSPYFCNSSSHRCQKIVGEKVATAETPGLSYGYFRCGICDSSGYNYTCPGGESQVCSYPGSGVCVNVTYVHGLGEVCKSPNAVNAGSYRNYWTTHTFTPNQNPSHVEYYHRCDKGLFCPNERPYYNSTDTVTKYCARANVGIGEECDSLNTCYDPKLMCRMKNSTSIVPTCEQHAEIGEYCTTDRECLVSDYLASYEFAYCSKADKVCKRRYTTKDGKACLADYECKTGYCNNGTCDPYINQPCNFTKFQYEGCPGISRCTCGGEATSNTTGICMRDCSAWDMDMAVCFRSVIKRNPLTLPSPARTGLYSYEQGDYLDIDSKVMKKCRKYLQNAYSCHAQAFRELGLRYEQIPYGLIDVEKPLPKHWEPLIPTVDFGFTQIKKSHW